MYHRTDEISLNYNRKKRDYQVDRYNRYEATESFTLGVKEIAKAAAIW